MPFDVSPIATFGRTPLERRSPKLTDAGRVVVTGANGFVGRALSRHLMLAGYSVRAISRRGWHSDTDAVEQIVTSDFAAPELYHGAEHVVHLAARAHQTREQQPDLEAYRATNVELSCRVAEAATRAKTRRLVFFSTIGVLGDRTFGSPFDAESAPDPKTAYAASKLEAEERLEHLTRCVGLELTIIRPALVYGQSAVGNLDRLAGLIASGLPVPLGHVRNRRNLLSLDALCDLACRALEHPSAAGAKLLAADSIAVSTPDIIQAIAAGLGTGARLLPVPLPLVRLGLGALFSARMASQLLDDFEVDATGSARLLAWHQVEDTASELRNHASHWRPDRSRSAKRVLSTSRAGAPCARKI